MPAGLLAVAHLAGCAAVALLGWLYWAMSVSEGSEPGSEPRFAILGLALLVVAAGMSITLATGRRRLALVLLVLEAVLGAALVWNWLDVSIQSDSWVYVGAVAVKLTGLGAMAAAEPRQARPGAR